MNILEEAIDLTTKARQKCYGHPAADFARASNMYAEIMNSDLDPRLKHPLMMICVKMARLLETPDHRDSIVDIAGYANTYAMVLERMPPPSTHAVDDNHP